MKHTSNIDNLKNEASEVINELLDCIDWLGGDAYEVEAAENMCINARIFLEKYEVEKKKKR